jgi:polyhydroxyalkanoate synthesis regulator phasin
MLETLRKTLFTGIGLAYMTKEKAEEIGKKIAQEARLSESEGKRLISELKEKSDAARDAVEKMVNDAVDKTLAQVNVPSRKEFDALKRRVEAMEKTEEKQ